MANPLVDFNFTADPTAVEYEGRLYVYATNDQQCDEKGPDSDNTYERIKTLAMMSTEDMVNWTWHGIINVEELSPWIYNSWAPSVASQVEEDGKTHFYLYFSNSGNGFDYSNNHAHLHKYKGKWYLFYHSMSLHHNLGLKGGYRNVSVEEIPVDEQTLKIEMIPATYEVVQQIETLNPFDLQQMETTVWKSARTTLKAPS